MTEDFGLKLLSAVESLMAEVVGLRQDMSRNGDATEQLRKLRAAGAKRMAKSRQNANRSRNGDATPSRNSDVTGDYRGKSLELEEKKKELTPTPVTPRDVTPKDRVWAFWKLHLGKASHSKFDRKRQKAVEARLRDGYTVDQLCEAIQGCKLDPFSMGKNDRQQRYDDLSLICRDAAHVDKFIALAPRASTTSNGATRLASWEQHAKEDEEVLARHGIGKAS